MVGPPCKASSGSLGSSGPSTAYLSEGLVRVHLPEGDSVFFNPAQVFNRDLSILVLKAFATQQKELIKQRSAATAARCKAEGRPEPQALEFAGLNVLEPLAATGLRSLRYLKELEGVVKSAVANDLDPQAAQQAKANATLNEIQDGRFHVVCADGCRLMHLLAHPPLSRTTLKKLNALPAGAALPDTFDVSCPEDELPLLPGIFRPSTAEAAAAGGEVRGKGPSMPLWIDVVDVDPYGSCSPFLDSAVAALRSGGLLCLTSTDVSTLVGNSLETAFYKYGGATHKISAHHEVSLRLVLQAVAQAAARQRRAVQPLLGLSVDFYVRLFVRVVESPEQCKQLHQKEGMLFHCPACEAFVVAPLGTQSVKPPRNKTASASRSDGQTPHQQQQQQQQEGAAVCQGDSTAADAEGEGSKRREGGATGGRVKYRAGCVPSGVGPQCAECGGQVLMGGPFYSGPYYDPEFVDLCLAELAKSKETLPGLTMQPRILGMLTALREELPDVPLHYQLPSLCTRHKLSMIKPAAFKAALRRLGYKASHFHRDPQAVKTDAPVSAVFDLIREHARKNPPANIEKFPMLTKPIQTQGIDFSPASVEEKRGALKEPVARWLPNPAPYWGPKGRAGKKRAGTDAVDTAEGKRHQGGDQAPCAASTEASENYTNIPEDNPLL